jgi:hypothetical protein
MRKRGERGGLAPPRRRPGCAVPPLSSALAGTQASASLLERATQSASRGKGRAARRGSRATRSLQGDHSGRWRAGGPLLRSGHHAAGATRRPPSTSAISLPLALRSGPAPRGAALPPARWLCLARGVMQRLVCPLLCLAWVVRGPLSSHCSRRRERARCALQAAHRAPRTTTAQHSSPDRLCPFWGTLQPPKPPSSARA